ncbi:MAG: NERD domain-containing protein [Clostridia bacterium]|nr:NERD domain-containing protein [Clostridia bacterium]
MIILIIALVIVLLAVIGITVLRRLHNTPEAKGKRGEEEVIYTIEHTNQGKFYLINDIILRDKHGMTHQIDHIAINANGVFVIETKNYSGRIYGRENQAEWTQILAYGNTKNKLKNPVKQNKSHLYCLRNVLPQAVFRPLVVFVQNNTENIQADTVIPLKNLPYELTRNVGFFLTERQMQNYYERILAAKSDVNTDQHVDNIYRQQYALEKGICPRCGGKLVVRVRKDGGGNFYGCSNYPECKFTKNID